MSLIQSLAKKLPVLHTPVERSSSHLMETQESITGIDVAFHLKSDLNLKGGFDRAP